jgi:hypothetical protein
VSEQDDRDALYWRMINKVNAEHDEAALKAFRMSGTMSAVAQIEVCRARAIRYVVECVYGRCYAEYSGAVQESNPPS